MSVGAIIATAAAIIAALAIPTVAIGGTLLSRTNRRKTKRFGVAVVDCPFSLRSVDDEIGHALSVIHDFEPAMADALHGALRFVTVIFEPGEYVTDDFGNKNHGHTLGRLIILADKGGIDIRRTVLAHELAHIAVASYTGQEDRDHAHPVFRTL